MLPLSANSDFKKIGSYTENPYRDFNLDEIDKCGELFGYEALDQAIEAVITTEPYERLFNLDFWSPFYKLLFNNSSDVDGIITQVFDTIERWVAVSIDRDNADVEVDSSKHIVSLKIPYYYNNGLYHVFSRKISA